MRGLVAQSSKFGRTTLCREAGSWLCDCVSSGHPRREFDPACGWPARTFAPGCYEMSMPARIDRGARFRQLCTIATQIIAKEGLAAPTIRRLAEEAGIAPNSVRHLFPTQESMLIRTAAELTHRWDERWPFATGEETVRDRSRAVVAAMIPHDEESRVRAQALAAFAGRAHRDSPLAESMRRLGVTRSVAMSKLLRRMRWMALPGPRPALVTLASDYRRETPDDLEPAALELLIVSTGLTTLICDHEIPLSFDAAARWLNWWDGPQLESGP